MKRLRMKKFTFLLAMFFAVAFASAQNLNPVSWSFASKKIGNNVYQVQMIASIQKGWHVYSQNQPKDAIAEPTSFAFNKNPLLLFDGDVKELGKLEKYKDEELDISANQYTRLLMIKRNVPG